MLTEIHEHFDVNDVKTGYTVITREPLWNDDDRERAIALDEFERSLCPCGCGLPKDKAFDPAREFSVEMGICHARRTLETQERRDRESAEKKNKPESFFDGAFWFVDQSRIA